MIAVAPPASAHYIPSSPTLGVAEGRCRPGERSDFRREPFALVIAEPVHPGKPRRADGERALRPDDDALTLRLEPQHIERLRLAADLQPATLAHREMDQAAMRPQHLARAVDDLAGAHGIGADLFDDAGIIAVGHEADILAVGLGGDRQADGAGDVAHPVLGEVAEREAEEFELFAGRGEQEVALVAGRIGGAVQLGAVWRRHATHIMARRQTVGAQIAREPQEIGELDPLVARDAGHWGAAARIIVGKPIDHACAEPAFIIEDVMGDPDPLGDGPRVMDIPARAAALGPLHRDALVVQLKRDADHLGAGLRGQRGHDRAVDAARHGNDDPGALRGPVELEIRVHHPAR